LLSPDGHCRAFDKSAAGAVGGAGCGVVVMRRLDDALREGDPIIAIVKGTAINNDGNSKAGYTAPSVTGQAEVIMLAHAVADIHPDEIDYVEAHGTGTPLGDPIEVAALTNAFQVRTKRTQYCAIGSLKTNVGHLDTAAGVAGVIKTALALERETIPPILHFRQPNSELNLSETPFFVNQSLRAWKRGARPR